MKILVLSDSHYDTFTMVGAVEKEKPDIICHCGDHYSDCAALSRFPDIPLYDVRGNCDKPGGAPDFREITAEGRKIFMTHGHLYGVKYDLKDLINNAMLRNADILLFGHTHYPYLRELDGLYIMNPGAAKNGVYGLVTIDSGHIECRLTSL